MANEQLRREIRKKYKTDMEMAEKMGWTKQKLSKTILGQRYPKVSDINAMSNALEISVEKVISFFIQ